MAVEDNIEVTQEEIDAVEPVDVEITDETVNFFLFETLAQE